MLKMLIADDNKQICNILEDFARKEGYETHTAFDGEEALTIFHQHDFDIILLDVIMPKINGFDVCKSIRKESSTPIIMITAKGEDYDKIMGLDTGADDYIVKPFSPAEVMARVRAILRRIDRLETESAAANALSFGNLTINISTYGVAIDQEPIALTKKEFELLWTLAANRNRVFTRDNLLDSIWGYDYMGDTRTVDSHIKRLRAKFEEYEHPHWEINTVWGVGYQFKVDDHEK